MKKSLFLFAFGLLTFTTSIQAQDWVQVGANIDGEAAEDVSGWSVSINSDGSIVAIGAPENGGNGVQSGQVRVYQNISGTWTQIGQDIDGEAGGDLFGYSVSLNSDGSIVAIGALLNDGNGLYSGHVRIYQNISGVWTQIGSDIDGEASYHLGSSVSISSDGSIVAIGAYHSGANGPSSGQARIYQNISGTWTQVGAEINGEASGDNLGRSVSISSDGSIVAVGAPKSDANGYNSGQVRVFQNISGTWTQIGQNLNGEASGDNFGWSVDLSSDGSIVAIGAPKNDGNGSDSGQVRVFQNISGTWTQIGQNLIGEASGDNFGRSVSLSSEGSIVAIGAPKNDGNGSDSGHVRIFQNISNTWIQIDQDIDGETSGDFFGNSVSLSSDGSVVAIGAPDNDVNSTGPGYVRVYENASLGISELQEAGISIYPNPSSGVFNIKNAENYDITITDITGKIVYHTTATTNEQVRLQQTGVYIIHFSSEAKRFSYKIIVE